MARLEESLAAPIGNPATSNTSTQHTEIQQNTTPAASLSSDGKTITLALAMFFIIIFLLHKAEKWVRKGVA